MFAASGQVNVKLVDLDKKEVITAEEFKTLIDEDNTIFVIDVREQSELETVRLNIPNLIWVPKSMMDTGSDADRAEIKKLLGEDTNKKFFLHCNTHGRSPNALKFLQALGYTNIVVVEGGIQKLQHIMPKNSITSGSMAEPASSPRLGKTT